MDHTKLVKGQEVYIRCDWLDPNEVRFEATGELISRENYLCQYKSFHWWKAEYVQTAKSESYPYIYGVKINEDVTCFFVTQCFNKEEYEELTDAELDFSGWDIPKLTTRKQRDITTRAYNMTAREIKEKLKSINDAGRIRMLCEQSTSDLSEEFDAYLYVLRVKYNYAH